MGLVAQPPLKAHHLGAHPSRLGTLTGDDPITRLGDGQCNVLYGWHSYGAVGNDDEFGSPNDWDNEAASLANHRKVFEFLRDNDIPDGL